MARDEFGVNNNSQCGGNGVTVGGAVDVSAAGAANELGNSSSTGQILSKNADLLSSSSTGSNNWSNSDDSRFITHSTSSSSSGSSESSASLAGASSSSMQSLPSIRSGNSKAVNKINGSHSAGIGSSKKLGTTGTSAGSASTASPLLSKTGSRISSGIVERSEAFFERHNIRLKVRRLPLQEEELREATTEGRLDQLPLYHFVTRQKRHMTEQLLRNRSSYITHFNLPHMFPNSASPYVLKHMPPSMMQHLQKMSNDFDDPEFSGVWLSLHTQPFVTDSEFGSLARSKIVGWALIEVLTTNERCLKGLWIHPKLSCKSASFLLRGFLPRVVYEAFELIAPQADDTCPWKFVYCWLNDFDMLPRQTWILLTSQKFFGLPKHFDNLSDYTSECSEQDTAKDGKHGHKSGKNSYKNNSGSNRSMTPTSPFGHSDDGNPIGSSCACQKLASWDDWDQVLVGCTEHFMYKNMDKWINMVPINLCETLKDDANSLPLEKSDATDVQSDDLCNKESNEDVYEAETMGLDFEELKSLLKYLYGNWSNERLRSINEMQALWRNNVLKENIEDSCAKNQNADVDDSKTNNKAVHLLDTYPIPTMAKKVKKDGKS